MGQYRMVSTSAELSAALEASRGPVVLFLYDPYCPTNWHARQELDELADDIWLVDVASNPGMSREVETRTGVRHESPQVLVLRHGGVQWHASHRSIRFEQVRAALRRAA